MRCSRALSAAVGVGVDDGTPLRAQRETLEFDAAAKLHDDRVKKLFAWLSMAFAC